MPATVAVPRPSLPGRCRQAMRGVGGPLLLAPLARAVGRVVVDYQNVRLRRETEDLLDQPRQVLHLVIGGHRDQSRAGLGHDLTVPSSLMNRQESAGILAQGRIVV